MKLYQIGGKNFHLEDSHGYWFAVLPLCRIIHLQKSSPSMMIITVILLILPIIMIIVVIVVVVE